MAQGARRVADVDPAHLRALNVGTASCRTLSEALAIDQSALVRAVVPDAGPEELLERIRPAADDEHFSVREWAWMAVRPHLVPELDASIAILAGWTADPSRSVQDSVGNWINDAAKSRPDWARGLAARWRSEAPDPLTAGTARILARGLRSLPA